MDGAELLREQQLLREQVRQVMISTDGSLIVLRDVLAELQKQTRLLTQLVAKIK